MDRAPEDKQKLMGIDGAPGMYPLAAGYELAGRYKMDSFMHSRIFTPFLLLWRLKVASPTFYNYGITKMTDSVKREIGFGTHFLRKHPSGGRFLGLL
jgi:hypothetical protein